MVNAAEVLPGFSQEFEIVDLILQNMDLGQRTHFVFSKRLRAVLDLYTLGRELSNYLVAGRERLTPLAPCLQRVVPAVIHSPVVIEATLGEYLKSF